MGTFYVSKAGSDPGTENDPTDPYLTIGAALADATTSGDIVEVTDEGTYNEGNLWNRVANITVRHTASLLGRPTVDGAGLGDNNAFTIEYDNYQITGLEIKNQGDYTFKKTGGGNIAKYFHVSGCFIHDVPQLSSGYLQSTSATTFKQCVMFFEPGMNNAILIGGQVEISNCLITASNLDAGNSIIYDIGSLGTASFNTIINRGTAVTKPVIICGKAINNIVWSDSSLYLSDGIGSDDQTYNLVSVPGHAFINKADSGIASPATGSGQQVATYAQLDFEDGTSKGTTISVAANYDIGADSLAIGNGVTYDSIAVDITGTIRPQGGSFDIGAFEYISSDPVWTEYSSQPDSNFKDGFIIQTYNNLPSNYKFSYTDDPGQAPFSLGTKGPSTLRSRSKPYKTTK
jgi:hypothetical protein